MTQEVRVRVTRPVHATLSSNSTPVFRGWKDSTNEWVIKNEHCLNLEQSMSLFKLKHLSSRFSMQKHKTTHLSFALVLAQSSVFCLLVGWLVFPWVLGTELRVFYMLGKYSTT